MMMTAVLLAFLLLNSQAPQPKGGKMTTDEIVAHVKQKDWNLLMHKGLVSQAAGPSLLPLLDDPDSQVRELTVGCLNAAGGPAAAEGLLKALRDKTDTVRSAAARFLAAHYRSSDIPVIEGELENSRDAYVREQLALLLGRTDSSTEIPVLQRYSTKERDEDSRHAYQLALARLGDPGPLQVLIARLEQHDAKERVLALRDLPYVNNRSILTHVRALLDDVRPGLNVGLSSHAVYIRVCDVAVNIVNEMLGGPFPWVERTKQYSPAEIAQVSLALSSIR
jgi:HEAT repeats